MKIGNVGEQLQSAHMIIVVLFSFGFGSSVYLHNRVLQPYQSSPERRFHAANPVKDCTLIQRTNDREPMMERIEQEKAVGQFCHDDDAMTRVHTRKATASARVPLAELQGHTGILSGPPVVDAFATPPEDKKTWV